MALDTLSLGLDEGTTGSTADIAGKAGAWTANVAVFEAPAAAIAGKPGPWTASVGALQPNGVIAGQIGPWTTQLSASVTGGVSAPGTSSQLGQLFLGSAELGVDLPGQVIVGGGESASIAAQIGAWTAQAAATTGNEDCDITGDIGAWTASVACSTLASIATINGQIGAWKANVTAQADTNHSAASINALVGQWTTQLAVRTTSFAAGRSDSKIKRRKVKIDGQWVDFTDEEWLDHLNNEKDEPEPEVVAPKPEKRPRTAPDKRGLLVPAQLPPVAPLPFQAPQIDHSQAIRFAQHMQHVSNVKQDDEDVAALLMGMD